jgi:hypothetical protein
MPENDPGTTGRSAEISGRSTSNYLSIISRRPEARLNGRSAAGKRIRDLFRALMTRLNQPTDPLIVADCLALVELKTAAEIARANLLEGKVSSSNELVRLENLVRRAEARVGLEAGAGAKVDPPDWRDLLPDDEEDEEQPGTADVTEGDAP